MIIAQITDHASGQWWCMYYGCMFQVLSIRQLTVVVKCNCDEGYQPPYNFHEFPKEAVILSML